MNKQMILAELRSLLEQVEKLMAKDVSNGVLNRIRHLCDLLDAMEQEGR